MTEAEWLEGNDVRAMIRLLTGRASMRKCILFAAFCCHRVSSRMPAERSRRLIELAVSYGDGSVARDVLQAAKTEADAAWHEAMRLADEAELEAVASVLNKYLCPVYREARRKAWAAYSVLSFLHFTSPTELADNVASFTRTAAGDVACTATCPVPADDNPERLWQGQLLNEIFGNPFRPVAFAPEWRTSTAVAIAKGMYESRDFFAMPILADALQDAGCDSDDILNHCRDAKATHVRGCWVVDLVLGKT